MTQLQWFIIAACILGIIGWTCVARRELARIDKFWFRECMRLRAARFRWHSHQRRDTRRQADEKSCITARIVRRRSRTQRAV